MHSCRIHFPLISQPSRVPPIQSLRAFSREKLLLFFEDLIKERLFVWQAVNSKGLFRILLPKVTNSLDLINCGELRSFFSCYFSFLFVIEIYVGWPNKKKLYTLVSTTSLYLYTTLQLF
ncbi:hypothetical protein CEXT_564551 [Caerostris extrusa]|uniref:Maturase K n=1 Tax=Caerostris extrusa TaxID=172846 RepID=A0AAV4R692_CAEEX|nr:hypothetical protein CEXT_564551 [Caerostris extrusa]